jgi:hypothetical protein
MGGYPNLLQALVVLGSDTKPSVASAATMAAIRHGRQRVIVPLPFDKTRVAVCHRSRYGEKMAWTSWAGRDRGYYVPHQS